MSSIVYNFEEALPVTVSDNKKMPKFPSFKSSSSSSLPPPISDAHHFQPQLSPSGAGSQISTPSSTTQPSPALDLMHEYSIAVQSNSYTEMWSRIHQQENGETHLHLHQLLLSQVLQPSRDAVEEALCATTSTSLTELVSAYFKHSENTTSLCLFLYHCVYQARALYSPIHDILDVLPHDDYSYTLSESQCHSVFEVFLKFDRPNNPFSCTDSHNFEEIRHSLCELKQKLDTLINKSRTKLRVLHRAISGPTLCLIGVALAAAITGIVIATHTLAAIIAAPCCCLPRCLTKKEMTHIEQLDAASMCTYVLSNDLDTINRLVARLHTHIEGDKFLIRIGLERENERHPMEEVLKQLHKSHLNIDQELNELEERICICFNTVNKTRSRLLQQILLHPN